MTLQCEPGANQTANQPPDQPVIDDLANGLARLETRLAALAAQNQSDAGWQVPAVIKVRLPAELVAEAVRAVWPQVAALARGGDLNLSATTVADLNARLCTVAGLARADPTSAVQFANDWGDLIQPVIDADAEPGDDPLWWDYLVLAALAWDASLPALGLTTAWLFIGGWRLQTGLPVVAPNPALDEPFLAALDSARPGLWDAESLRGGPWFDPA